MLISASMMPVNETGDLPDERDTRLWQELMQRDASGITKKRIRLQRGHALVTVPFSLLKNLWAAFNRPLTQLRRASLPQRFNTAVDGAEAASQPTKEFPLLKCFSKLSREKDWIQICRCPSNLVTGGRY